MNAPSHDNDPDASPISRQLHENVVVAREPVDQRLPTLSEEHLQSHRPRYTIPVILFLATCASTFWAGITNWNPPIIGNGQWRHLVLLNGWQGATYTGCVLAILLAHEMGHYIATRIHRIPASLPFFIPFPFTPIGTMGAVIALDGRRADRREIFDIGLAGPIAGLVVAIPILLYGVHQLDATRALIHTLGDHIDYRYDCPLVVEWMVGWMHPQAAQLDVISRRDLNPYLMAGWVGLLITGLNMLPISQLDGGHVIYTLFGKAAHWVARGFIIGVILVIAFGDHYLMWAPMTIIVILLGTDHPPTRDDAMPLGRARKIIGYASLLIPVLCFPPKGIMLPY